MNFLMIILMSVIRFWSPQLFLPLLPLVPKPFENLVLVELHDLDAFEEENYLGLEMKNI